MIPKKILIVDDEPDLRDVLKRLVNRLGYNASVAADSKEAIKMLKTETFPLIITDLNMPGMNGIQLCKTIRKTNSFSVIYALSSDIDKYGTQTIEESGFDGYMRKPPVYQKMFQAIEGAFDKIYKVRSVDKSHRYDRTLHGGGKKALAMEN